MLCDSLEDEGGPFNAERAVAWQFSDRLRHKRVIEAPVVLILLLTSFAPMWRHHSIQSGLNGLKRPDGALSRAANRDPSSVLVSGAEEIGLRRFLLFDRINGFSYVKASEHLKANGATRLRSNPAFTKESALCRRAAGTCFRHGLALRSRRSRGRVAGEST